MEFNEGKEKFIQSWGALSTNWGINRVMAQVHALLLISPHALSMEDIMKELKISRGATCTNLRALIEWGLVQKELRCGERKEFFIAEKDMWEIVRKIIIQRKKKELEPILKVLKEVSEVEGLCQESKEFCAVIQDIKTFSVKADQTLGKLSTENSKWLVNTFFK